MDDYQLMGGGGYGMSDDSGGGTRLIEDSSGMVSGMSYGRGPNPGMSGQALGPGMVPSHMPGTHQNPNSVMTGMVPQQSIQQHSANHLNAGNIMAYHQMAAQHGYQQSEVPQKLQHYGGYGGPQGVGGMGMANSQFPSSSRLQQMAEPSLAAGTTHQPQQQGSQSLTPMTPYQQQSMMGGGQYNQRPQMGAAGGVHMPSNASQYPGSYSVSHQQQQPAPQHQQPAVQQMGPGNEVWQGSMMHSPQHHRPYTGQGPSYTQHSQPAPMSPVQHGPASMTASPVPMQVPRPATPNQNQYVGGQDYGVHPGVQASAPQRPYYSVGVPSSHTSQNGMQVGHVAGAASGTVSQTSSHIPVSQSEQMLSSYSSQGQFTPSSQTLGVRPTQSAANAMSHSSAGQMMSGNRTMQRVGYSSPHHHVNSGVQQGSPARMPQYQCSTYSPGQPYSQPSGMGETPTPTRLSPYPSAQPVQAPSSPQYRPSYPSQATLSPRRPTPTPPMGSPMPPSSHTPDRMGHPPNSSTPQSQGSYPSPGASHMSSPGQGLSPGSTVTPSSSLQQLEQMVMPHIGGGPKQSAVGTPSTVASASGSAGHPNSVGNAYYTSATQPHSVSQQSLMYQQTQTPPLQPMQQQQQQQQQQLPHHQYHPQMSPSVNQQSTLTPLGTTSQSMQGSVGGMHHGGTLHNDSMVSPMQQLPTSMPSYANQTSNTVGRPSMGHDVGYGLQQPVNSPGGGPTLTTLTTASQQYHPSTTGHQPQSTSVMYEIQQVQQQLQHLYSLPQSTQNDQKISELQEQLQYLQSQTSTSSGCPTMPPAVNTQPPSSVYLPPTAPQSTSPQLPFNQQQYQQQPHFEPQLEQPHMQHDGMGGSMPVYGDTPQLSQLHDEGLSQDHESHGHLQGSDGLVPLAPPPPPPPPPQQPENGMMDDGVFAFTEDDMQDLPPMLRPVKRGKPKGKSTKPKKPPKSKKGMAATPPGVPGIPPPPPMGDMEGSMPDATGMPPAVMGMPPISAPVSDEASLGMDEMPHLVPEENLEAPRCTPMQEMPIDPMDPDQLDMMGMSELPPDKKKKSKKRKTKERDPNAPPKEPKPKKPKKPKAPKEPKERKEPKTPKKPKTPKQPKEPKVKSESETPPEEGGEPKELKEAKDKSEKKEKKESKPKTPKSTAPREARSKGTPKKKLPKLALKFKKKKRKRLGSSDHSDLEVTPPPSPEETEDGVQKRRSARNTKRKKYTDDIELAFSEDDTLDVDQDRAGGNRAVQVMNVNLEDTMVVEKIMASRIAHRELEVEPGEENESQQPTTIEVEEFFVKYKNLSYIHCDWKTAEELEKGDRKIGAKIKRYKQKKDAMNNFFDFLEEDPYNPDYVEVDRILDVNEIVEFIDDDEEQEAEEAIKAAKAEENEKLENERDEREGEEVANKQPPEEMMEVDQAANGSEDEKMEDDKPKDFDDSSQETIIDKEEEEKEEEKEPDGSAVMKEEGDANADAAQNQMEMMNDEVVAMGERDAAVLEENEEMMVICKAEEAAAANEEEAETGAKDGAEKEPSPAEPKKERKTRIVRHYLVKWRGLPYEDSTWELEEDVDRPKIEQFLRFREPPPKEKWKMKKRPKPPEWTKLEVSPIYKGENTLREYQLEGLNWLTFCWYNGQNCILADEMGLGKTIQSIAFLNEVANYGITGPYLVIAPLSTIGNWQREFETWTDLNVITYHGSSASRNMLQEYEMYYKNEKGERITEVYKFQVMITTFEIVLHDCLELREIPWRCVIIDEAHRLKNRNCKLLEGLRLLNMEHRVLLTGTPLQNNVEELFSLLNFLEPTRFASTEAFLEEFGDLKTENQVDKLKALLKPMMLRRLKEDVEKSLAPKEETIVEVELTNIQKKYYRAILERNFAFLTKGGTGTNMPNLMNTMMELRKCCIHPFLISGAEEQILMEYKAQHSDMQDVSLSAMINSSGKLVLIDKLLPRLRADGHRVLIFSQMVRCLDILEDYLVHRRYPYERIDGRVRGNLRQAAIDRFCKPDSDRFVFLLCTRAGGLGINLTAADTVIIFDSDWNPQNDLQAQARCHRIGQSKAVKVYRLICRNTYEREMFDKASLKLGLDKAVLQSMNSSKENLGMSHQLSKKEIEDLLRKGAYGALMDDDNAGDKFCEEDIDQILQRRTHVITLEGGAKGSTFAKATFSSSNCADIEVDDPNFWEKWAKRANLDVDELKNKNELIVQEPRRRTQTKRFGAEDSMLDLSDLESSDEDDESISARTRGGRRSSKGALGIPRSRNRNRRSGFEKGMGDEIFEDVAPGNWTRAECFKVEKGLLTFGWGRWEECLALGNFKRNFTMKDIEDISRIVLLYCLQNYKGDEKIKGFIWDLITPTEDGETKIHKNHSGLSAPVPRGRKGKKLKKDSKTSCEEDDTLADWAKEDKYNTELLLNDEGYKRHLHRHANKVLLRVRLLYYLKHEVIGDLHDQVVSHVPASEIPLPTPIADGEPPAPWWDQEADKSLLVGVYKHGFERYNVMRQDPALCFFARCGPPDGAALLAEINIFSRNDDEMDEKTSQKDKADKDDDKDDKPDKDDLDELEEPVSPSPSEREPNLSLATPALSVAASEAGTIESSIPDYCPGELGKFPFPSVCDLNTRLRRIITGYQRSFKKEEIKLAQRARRMERREKFEAAIKERELKKRELQQRRWSRREEADFYRTISSFGVEYNHEKQQYDWSRFRAIGRLERKFDDTLTEYYKAFYAMCKRVCGRKLSEEEEQFPLIVEPISEERASRCLQRIDLLNKIREEILHHPQLDERLKLCQSSMDLPDWWQCGKHDKDLLIGAARHGLSRMDYHLLHDPELSFKDVLKMKPPTGYPSGGSQWSTPAGGASPVVPFLSGGDEKDVVVSCSETEEKPALKPPPTPVEPAPDSIEKPKTPVDKKPGEDAGDAEVKAPDADEASALPKKEEPMADSKSDVETKMEDDALAATETKDAIKQEEEEEDVKSEDTEPMAITESTVDSSGEGGKEMAEAKTNADSMEESKEAQSVEPIPADQANSDKPQGSEREETKPFSEVDMKEDAAAAAVTTAEQKPDITVVKQEEDEKSDLHSKQDDNMETASQNDELMSQESFNLEYDGGEPTVAQLLAHSARNPIRWPKDKVLQIRLEHICHAVEKNEWPVLRHTFLPSFPVVTTPNIGASVVTTSTTPAPLESSPRPASPVPSTSSQGAASGEATPQATPEHTPRREPTPQDIPISLPEYPSAPTTGSPVFMLNEGGKVPRRRRRRRRAEIEAERAKLRALLSHNIQQQVQQFMPPPPSIMSTPLRASLREDHSYSDDKPSSLPPSTAPTISSSAPPPAHQNSAPRISTTLGSLDLRVKPALSMPVPSVVPPPPPPPVVTPTPPSDTANSPSSPMDLSSSSTPTGIEGAAGNPLVHSTEPSSPTRRTRSSPSSSTPSSASLLNGAVRGRGRGRGRGRWGGGGGSRIDALALNLQARKQQQLLAQQQQQECRDTAPEASSKPASEHEHSKHHLSHADVDEQADTSRLTRKQSPKPDESSRLLRSRTSAVSGASPSLSGSWSTSSMSHRTSSTKHGENIMPNRLPTGLDIMKLGLKPEESTPNPSSLVEQAAAIRQDLKKWLEDHPEVVASNPTLAAAAAAAMAFNPMPSMPPNTELLELPEGRRRGRRPRVDPSKLDFGAITGEENVSVINRLTGKKITGSKAPPLKHLAEWLEKNPMFDVDPKWGPLVREKGNLPDNMRKRIITPSEKRGRRTAASLLASAHQSMNTPTSMMSSFPPASGLNPLNFANAGMLSGFPGMKFFMDPSKGSSASSSSSSTAPSSTASAPIFFPFGGLAGMGLASPLFGFPGFNLQGLQGQNPLSTPGVNSSEKDGSSGDKSKGSEKGVSGSGRSKSASAPITCASSVASTSSATSLPFLYPAPGLLYNPLGLSSFALSPNMSTSFASLAQAGLVNGLGGLGTSAAPVSTTAPSTTSAAASSSSSLNVSSSNIASNIAASASLAKSLLSSSATLPSLTTTTTSAPSVASSSLLAGQDSDDESLKSLMGNDEDEDDDLNGDLDDNLESADKDDSDLDDELQRLKSESSLRRDSSMSSLLKQQVESVLSAAANSKLHQKKADAKQSPSAAVVVPTPKAAGGDTSTSQTTSPAVEKDNPS